MEGGQGGEPNIPDSTCEPLDYEGDVAATTNAALGALSGVTRLVGALSISGQVSDLSALGCLSRIEGRLRVDSTDALTNLSGLEQLHFVSGDVDIGGMTNGRPPWVRPEPAPNQKLENLDGLSGLLQVGGNLRIRYNDALTSADGLQHLQRVGAWLDISDNASLANTDGFSGLTQLSHLSVGANPSLVSYEGFSGLTQLSDLYVDSSAALASLEGFRNLESVEGTLSINGFAALDGLRHLKSAGSFSISGDALASLTGLVELASLGRLSVSLSPLLRNLHGLERIQRLTTLSLVNSYLETTEGLGPLSEMSGTLTLWGNLKLGALEGLQGVRALQELHVRENSALVDLSLNSLKSVAGVIEIVDNPALPNLDGLFDLDRVGDLIIRSNAALSNFDALKLTRSGNIYVQQNPKLARLAGFSALRIAGDVTIQSNDSLPNLAGLERLEVATTVTLKANAGMTSLAGLDSLRTAQSIMVSDNPQLTNFGGLHAQTGLAVSNNSALTSMAGLENARSLERVSIAGNANLKSLNGLDSLDSLVNLEIRSCPSLRDLRGLRNVSEISWQGVSFQSNAVLPNCEIEWFINHVLRLDGPIEVAGNDATGTCDFSNLTAPATAKPPQITDVPVQAVVNGTLGCHAFADVYAEPWQTDPAYTALTPDAAAARLRQRLVGTWAGSATALGGWFPSNWTVVVDFLPNGTFTSSGMDSGTPTAAFYYGGWAKCGAEPWSLANPASSLRVFGGTLDAPTDYDTFCEPNRANPGLIERVREDVTLTRLRFSFRQENVKYGVLYDLRRVCPIP